MPDDEPEQAQSGKGSVGGPRSLSAEMRIFADAFIANGGNATDAAISAGVDPDKASVQASRWLCREAVATHIKNQVGRFVHSTIPFAVRALVEIAGDPKALPKDRIKAANSLIDLAGIAPKGPGLQVNLAVVNGSQAQAIISEVHNARQARLSDIPPAMPDTMQADLNDIEQTIEAVALPAPADDPGGVELQGPVAATRSIPVPSSEHCPETDVSGSAEPDAEPMDEFRRAFDEGDE